MLKLTHDGLMARPTACDWLVFSSGFAEASYGQFLEDGGLLFAWRAEELLEGAYEFGLEVDQASGGELGGGGEKAPEVPRVLGE